MFVLGWRVTVGGVSQAVYGSSGRNASVPLFSIHCMCSAKLDKGSYYRGTSYPRHLTLTTICWKFPHAYTVLPTIKTPCAGLANFECLAECQVSC